MYENLEVACFFIGYPRSGHTLTGGLLDAHPRVCLSHELDVFKLLRTKAHSREVLLQLMTESAQAYAEAGSKNQGYNYHIPGLWQGKWDQLQVIGDKCGSHTTMELLAQPELLTQAQETLQLPLKFIHVIRNPYDVITTSILRTLERTPQLKLRPLRKRKIRKFFKHATFIDKLRREGTIDYLDVYHEQFVAHPQEELARIAEFLGIKVEEPFLKEASSIVFSSIKQSRHKVNWWTPLRRWYIKRQMAGISFFSHYTFQN